MRAVGLYRSLPIDHPESLLDVEVPKPAPGERDPPRGDQGNRGESGRCSGVRLITDTTLRILGWDAAGIVESVGRAVTLFKPGDPVYYAGDITRPGCNAEYHLVDERITGRKPASGFFTRHPIAP